MIPTLTTERLTLRAQGPEDIAAFTAMMSEPRTAFVGGPLSPELAWRSLAGEIGHWTLRGFGRWSVIERETDLYCGVVGLWFPEGWPEPEIGWTLAGAAEGRGIGQEAAEAALAHAYNTLGWSTAISLIDPANARSIALAQRLGAAYERDHTHPRFGDMGIWRHKGPAT